MSEIFENTVVDVKNARVYDEIMTSKSKGGYHVGKMVTDKYGNVYRYRHEVVIAEALQLPKHLWPVDDRGRRYVVDHIIPVSNGGTDAADNLRLIPLEDNPRNEMSRQNYSNRYPNAKKQAQGGTTGKRNGFLQYKLELYDKNNKLIKTYTKSDDIWNDGFNFHTVRKSVERGSKLRNGMYFKRT